MKKSLVILAGLVLVLTLAVGFPAVAEEATTTLPGNVGATTTPPVAPAPKKKTVDIACVKTAVEKRENAIQTSLDSYYNSIKTALQARKNELIAAWTLNEAAARKDAIKKAWKNFTAAKKTAAQAFRKTKIAIWKQFTIDRKACGASPTGEDSGADISF